MTATDDAVTIAITSTIRLPTNNPIAATKAAIKSGAATGNMGRGIANRQPALFRRASTANRAEFIGVERSMPFVCLNGKREQEGQYRDLNYDVRQHERLHDRIDSRRVCWDI